MWTGSSAASANLVNLCSHNQFKLQQFCVFFFLVVHFDGVKIGIYNQFDSSTVKVNSQFFDGSKFSDPLASICELVSEKHMGVCTEERPVMHWVSQAVRNRIAFEIDFLRRHLSFRVDLLFRSVADFLRPSNAGTVDKRNNTTICVSTITPNCCSQFQSIPLTACTKQSIPFGCCGQANELMK